MDSGAGQRVEQRKDISSGRVEALPRGVKPMFGWSLDRMLWSASTITITVPPPPPLAHELGINQPTAFQVIICPCQVTVTQSCFRGFCRAVYRTGWL